MEKGKGELSAVQEVKNDFGIDVYSIVTIEDIIRRDKKRRYSRYGIFG